MFKNITFFYDDDGSSDYEISAMMMLNILYILKSFFFFNFRIEFKAALCSYLVDLGNGGYFQTLNSIHLLLKHNSG